MARKFYSSCVDWPREDVHSAGGLCAMIQTGRPVSRRTFCRNVDRTSREEVERTLGYAPHDPSAILTMTRDYAVGYFSGFLHGERVYWFVNSAIEYVFR